MQLLSKPAKKNKKRSGTAKKTRKTAVKKGKRNLKKDVSLLCLEKEAANPIIEPNGHNSWEAWQTFNPAAIYLNSKVHFLYRAIGEGGVSVLGYASSEDGVKIKERLSRPAYVLRELPLIRSEKKSISTPLIYCSGGGVSGCEDPRMVELEGKIYITHTAFSSWSFVRVALSSIDKNDFLNRNWDKWNDPVFISPPHEIHKNWVLFPEKINGKFAVLHSISPDILIDYLDDLNFDGKNFIKSRYVPQPVQGGWEAYARGVGPPPIKTEHGWLLLYHGVEKGDGGKYKLGAMLLDHNDPTKILFRAKEPVLEPNCHYENNGFKPGIVYSCGAAVIGETLFVYYGGADSVVCVASTCLKDFVGALTKQERPKLKAKRRTRIKKKNKK